MINKCTRRKFNEKCEPTKKKEKTFVSVPKNPTHVRITSCKSTIFNFLRTLLWFIYYDLYIGRKKTYDQKNHHHKRYVYVRRNPTHVSKKKYTYKKMTITFFDNVRICANPTQRKGVIKKGVLIDCLFVGVVCVVIGCCCLLGVLCLWGVRCLSIMFV